ncbi:MAG: hypothetical protein GF315_04590 [candidate division Zixibacteria bacterium]|nr:hypothetical protein [candidate division Zixibacteria bacterium]
MKNILFIATALMIIGVLGCGEDKPLEQINWAADLDNALTMDKPVLIDFWKDG